MMNKNVNSPTQITEFAPLNSEPSPPVMTSIFSKLFGFGKSTNSNNADNPVISPAAAREDEQSSSGDSESWRQANSSSREEKSPDDDDSSVSMTFPVDGSEGRSLPNVLKRISNIVASKSSNLKSYKDSQLRSYWMPDSVAKQCYECGERFTTFRRRHHCRVCGQIFCSKCCSDEIPGKIMGVTGDLRVCTYCCKVVLSYLQSSDMTSVLSADLKALQEDLENKYGSEIISSTPIAPNDPLKDETRVSRKPSVGYMEEKYAIRRSSGGYLSSEERSMMLQNSASLRLICEELFRSCHAINLQTHRVRLKNHHNCFMGNELVNWMISQNKSTTRTQATSIGQALFSGGFIESCLNEDLFSDTNSIFKPVNLNRLMQGTNYLDEVQSICDAQEPAWVKNIPQNDSTTDSESEIKQLQPIARLPSSSSSFYLDLNLQSSIVTLKRPLTSENFTTEFNASPDNEQREINNLTSQDPSRAGGASDELLNDSLQVEVKERNSWHKVKNLKNSLGEMSSYNNLMTAYKQHEESLVKQLLNKEGLSQNWSDVIIPLAHQIIDQVRPDQNRDADDMDIREYVQIKKSPGGSRNDCEIVSGVVCSKNVAHRGMDAMIAHPKILLLQCGLMYQRVEGKLLSLEPVMLQENEYLGHTVARITALGPDVVLVHRSVSRLAQDRFRQCGVTLVLNVKLSVLERVARCTGGTIVNTIDAHLATRYKLGTCKKFYLRNFPNDKNGVKTLMYFETCANPHLGATILLRGGTSGELKKVKKVTSTMIFSAYSWRMEKSFLMDEFAKPPYQLENSFLDETTQKQFLNNKKEDIDSEPNGDKKEELNENSQVFKKVSGVLNQESDSYDTLKLFKSREKLVIDDSELSFEFKQEPKQKIREKILSEDKRVHGKSVSDHSDPLHQYLIEDEADVVRQISPTDQNLSVADLPLLNKFKNSLNDTILSFSPYLKFTTPYLETEPGRNCTLRSFFPKEIYHSSQFEEKIECGKTSSVSVDQQAEKPLKNLNLQPRHPFTMAKLTSGVESKQVQALLADFRSCGGRLPPGSNVLLEEANETSQQNEIVERPDCLDPTYHQRLSVLFCSFAHNANNAPASFCVNPWIVNMDLYGRNDIALGRFLERYCLTSEYKCPAVSCRAQLAQHGRRFAHDDGCVQITLKEMSSIPFGPENIDQILMWSKCIECKKVSPVVPMSSDTWSLSFAKYLELRFHGNIYTNRSSDTCQHSLHHDHYQYFSRRNMLAIFKFSKIKFLEISLPPPLININYDEKQHGKVIEEVKSIALKGDEVFSIIKEKIQTLQLDADDLVAVKQQLIKEQMNFKNKIEEVHMKLTSPTLDNKKFDGKLQIQNAMIKIEDGLVNLKRLIAEAVSSWNGRILEITTKKKDDRPRRFTDRSLTTGVIDTDGYITEDTASESQMEDLSPISADYNAIDAINSVHNEIHNNDVLESSDNEIPETPNPADILVLQDSPKFHQRSHSDVILSTAPDDQPDRRKRKKTILSQLLPSASTETPIANPLGPLEHHLFSLSADVPIVIYESEPSSIIAYALATHSYRQALQEILQKTPNVACSSPLNKRKNSEYTDSKIDHSSGSVGEFKKPSKLSFLRGSSPSPAVGVEAEGKNQSGSILTDGNNQNNQTTQEIEDDKKGIKQQNYIEVQFDDETTDFYCRIYFAAQFAALRENVLPCGEDGYTRSLSRCVQWAARGGKSGSTFCKSRDDRFIIKEMTKIEMHIFLKFALNYFSYMEKCQQTKQPTLLGKIVGVYRVSFKNNTTNCALRTSVLVMENLFYGRIIKDKFDLKGSVRNRLVNPDDTDNEGELVLLDENLLNMSCDSPLYIRPHSKAVLNKAIEKDTEFLADNTVMDYSLLVGLEPSSGELVLGIIDYIRTFTWDKRFETMVKKSGLLGGQGKDPTVVSPEEYRPRFIAAMHRYFLPVPDRWTGLGRGVVPSEK